MKIQLHYLISSFSIMCTYIIFIAAVLSFVVISRFQKSALKKINGLFRL